MLLFDGGPNGGNGEADKENAVGLVIAEEPEDPPFLELCPELIEEGLE